MSDTYHAGGCRKIPYPSRAQALLAMDRIRELSRRDAVLNRTDKIARKVQRARRTHPAVVQRAYACPHCGCWRLTSQGEKAA